MIPELIISHCEQNISLLNMIEENFNTTVTLFLHPKPINVLNLFVLTYN
jgi:hypothetical protein